VFLVVGAAWLVLRLIDAAVEHGAAQHAAVGILAARLDALERRERGA
jgi:hypothetical protein